MDAECGAEEWESVIRADSSDRDLYKSKPVGNDLLTGDRVGHTYSMLSCLFGSNQNQLFLGDRGASSSASGSGACRTGNVTFMTFMS